MRFALRLTVSAVTALLLSCGTSVFAQELHTYTEITGERQDSFAWRLSRTGARVEIESTGERERIVTACDGSGATREWKIVAAGQDLTVTREGNTLVFKGVMQGNTVAKTVSIDDTPWFQALSYSLRQFIASPEETTEFWHIRSDTLEPVKLSAAKIGLSTEDVCAGHKGFLVEIRPVGVCSPFWQASFWFRSGDHIFCRYESRHGGWGTPLTVISLEGQEG